MKRKVIQMGGKTMVISLPASWIKKYGIKKGDEMEVEEKGNNVIVNIGKSLAIDKTVLDIKDFGILGRRVMAALYKKGYDEIQILYEKPKDLIEIKKAIDLEAMNFEIVQQTNKSCIVKSISEATEAEFDNVLRRTFLVLLSMSKEILEGLKEKKINKITEARELEKINNKFTHFCRRALNKKGYKDYKSTAIMYTIIEQLENVADEFKFMCDYLTSPKMKGLKLNKKVMDLFVETNENIIRFYELFYKFDKEKAVKFSEVRKDIIKKSHILFQTLPNKEIVVVFYLMNVTQKVFEMFGPVLALIL